MMVNVFVKNNLYNKKNINTDCKNIIAIFESGSILITGRC